MALALVAVPGALWRVRGLCPRAKPARPGFEPCAPYLRVGESPLVDIVSLRSCTLVLYPVFLVVGLHEEAVRPSVLSNEAAHQLAIQVCDDGTVGKMACVAMVKCGAFGVYSVTTIAPRPPMRVWWCRVCRVSSVNVVSVAPWPSGLQTWLQSCRAAGGD